MANYMKRLIRDYVEFESSPMRIGIVTPKITTALFEFKLMMIQMLQTVGQFSGSCFEEP